MVPRNALQLAVFLRFVISRSGVRFVSPAPYKTSTYRLSRDTLFNPCKHYVSTWSDFGAIPPFPTGPSITGFGIGCFRQFWRKRRFPWCPL